MLDTLDECYDALLDLQKKILTGELDLDTFWVETEVIVDRARGIQRNV